jgi:hypothetical protein
VELIDHGTPIKFLQFDRPESEIWPHPAKATGSMIDD